MLEEPLYSIFKSYFESLLNPPNFRNIWTNCSELCSSPMLLLIGNVQFNLCVWNDNCLLHTLSIYGKLWHWDIAIRRLAHVCIFTSIYLFLLTNHVKCRMLWVKLGQQFNFNFSLEWRAWRQNFVSQPHETLSWTLTIIDWGHLLVV